jgi:AcrR family transcriptional regulator
VPTGAPIDPAHDPPVATTTRGRIAEVALAMFLDAGFAGTSLRMIADRVGVTQAAVYYHFRAKDDLLDALLTAPMEEFGQVLDEAGCRRAAEGTVDRRALLTAALDVMMEHHDVVRLLLGDVTVARHPVWSGHAAALRLRCSALLSGTPDVPDPATRTLADAALAVLLAGIAAGADGHELVLDAALRVLDTPRRRRHQPA